MAPPQSVRSPTMQVVEKSNEGLSRVIAVTIPVAELNQKLDAKLKEVAPQVKLKGFRPGKVPMSHVKKTFGRDLMGEIVNDALNSSSQQALDDAKVRPAAPAEMKLTSDMDKVIAGQEDLAYEMALEVMPDFTPTDIKALKLDRPTYEASDADLDEALTELAGQAKSYEDKKGKAVKAAEGDELTIDFLGKMDGEPFEGGCRGRAAGDWLEPLHPRLRRAAEGRQGRRGEGPRYHLPRGLPGRPTGRQGRDLRRQGQGHQGRGPGRGRRSLRPAHRHRIAGQAEGAAAHQSEPAVHRRRPLQAEARPAGRPRQGPRLPLPPKMVEAEFDGIWQQVQADKDAGRLPDEDAAKSEADLKDEYRKIAERRVRLGLVLAEIGRANNVQITDQELNNAIMNEARNYPGQERQVLDFYRQNPNAAAQMRAPIYEEKVCDLIFDTATVTDTPISKEDLLKEDDDL